MALPMPCHRRKFSRAKMRGETANSDSRASSMPAVMNMKTGDEAGAGSVQRRDRPLSKSRSARPHSSEIQV